MSKFFSLIAIAALIVSVLPASPALAAGAGDLIKCPDFSAVYYLAEDGKRYVFPNEHIFFSWYPDFFEVRTISCDDLATFPLGERVVYQAGTSLVKLPSDPSVFAVEPGGVLREIPDEATAIALFGDDWAERVDDVSEAFWPSFTKGETLTEDEIPEGTVLADDNGNLFRVEDDGSATEMDVILDTDQEDVLEDFALNMGDVEHELGVVLALTRVDAAQAIEVLQRVIAMLKTVEVDDDDEVEVAEIDEIDDDDDAEDAEDSINDAKEEITEAESDIAENEADGKDITASEEYLTSARAHLAAAEAAYANDDMAMAEEHADEAKHEAMWARGKAVESIDDLEDNDLNTDEEVDDNENADAEDSTATDEDVENDDDEHTSDDTNDNDDESDETESDDDGE